jgi:hypothetical protein
LEILAIEAFPQYWELRDSPSTRIALSSLDMAERRSTDVGGTAGGFGDFLLGFVMTCVGGYLLTNQVTVAGSYWNFWGTCSPICTSISTPLACSTPL